MPCDQQTAGPQPSSEWAADCMLWRKRILTGSKAHWCSDWDGLPVDETTPEFECCTCFAGDPAHD